MDVLPPAQLFLLAISIIAFVAICMMGSRVSMRLFARLRRSEPEVRFLWLLIATLCAASTIWSLHFLAVTLSHPNSDPYAAGINLGASLIGILVLVAVGFGVAAYRSTSSILIEIGGAIIGVGVAATHVYSLRAANELDLSSSSAVSLFFGFVAVAFFGAIATNRVARPVTRFCRYGGAAAFSIAISLCYILGNASSAEHIPTALQNADSVVSALIVCAIASAIILCGFATLSIDHRAAQAVGQQLYDLSLSDSVTGVRNRAGLERDVTLRLNDRDTDDQRFLMFAVEFTELNAINDAHGHDAGDFVLKTQASRLASWLQGMGSVGRMDGPRLVVMTPTYFSRFEIEGFKEAIQSTLLEPIAWNERSLIAPGRLGAAEFPLNGDDAADLVLRAEIAAKRAINDETIKVAMYDNNVDEKVRSNGALAMDLRHAISGGELEMYYQPQHSVGTRELIGFEALMRWNHPEQGMVPPFIFIPIAEQTGQIVALGDWAMLNSCQEAASWPVPVKVAVNVASQQLMATDFIEKLELALATSQLPPSQLEIEITESGIIGDHTRALETIRAVKALGVGVAMDDYGTGYSSLATLRSFPFDKIKIDREFIKDVEHDNQSQAIVQATVTMGSSLDIPVLAEGVECEKHMDFLINVGCSDVQGYLFGKPMPVSEVRGLLDSNAKQNQDRSADPVNQGFSNGKDQAA